MVRKRRPSKEGIVIKMGGTTLTWYPPQRLSKKTQARIIRGLKTFFGTTKKELGRRGGLQGGQARAKALTKKQLSDAGRKAVEARWAKHRKSEAELRRHIGTSVRHAEAD